MPDPRELNPQPMFQEVLAAVKRGEREIRIPPGTYRFTEEFPRLRFDKLEGVTLLAHGVTLLLQPRVKQPAFLLAECQEAQLLGATFDYDPLPFTQGRVIDFDARKHTVTLQIEEGYPIPDMEWCDQGGGNTKTIAFGRDGRMSQTRMDWAKSIEPATKGQVTIHLRGGWLLSEPGAKFAKGDWLALPDRNWRQTIHLQDCRECVMEDITVYSAPQMAFVENSGPGGNRYHHCEVIRKPGTTRLLSSNADVFHSINVDRGPTIRDCRAEFAGDDFVNIHGYLSLVVRPEGDGKTALCFAAREKDLAAGSQVTISDPSFQSSITAQVVKCEKIEDEGVSRAARPEVARMGFSVSVANVFEMFRVTFDKPVKAKSLIANEGSLPDGAVVRNCFFSDGYGRGIMLKAKNAVVSQNVLRRMAGAGIHVGAEGTWCDGPMPHDVKIWGNTIVESHRLLHPLPQVLGITLGNVSEADLPKDISKSSPEMVKVIREARKNRKLFAKQYKIEMNEENLVEKDRWEDFAGPEK